MGNIFHDELKNTMVCLNKPWFSRCVENQVLSHGFSHGKCHVKTGLPGGAGMGPYAWIAQGGEIHCWLGCDKNLILM